MLRKNPMQTEISEVTGNHSLGKKTLNAHVNDVAQQNGVAAAETTQRGDSSSMIDLEEPLPANLPESPYSVEGKVLS